jgi:hypothetical protein
LTSTLINKDRPPTDAELDRVWRRWKKETPAKYRTAKRDKS